MNEGGKMNTTNLLVKVIKTFTVNGFEKQINEFSNTNVTVVATQTHITTLETSISYVAVVYYRENLPNLG